MKSFCILFFAGLVILAGQAAPAPGADCSSMLKEAKETASLLQKRSLLESAVKQCPDNAEINYAYAYCLERLRKYPLALRYYHLATLLDPSVARYFFGLGDIHRVLDHPEEAVKAYKKGLKLEPGNKRILKYVAELSPEKPVKKAIKEKVTETRKAKAETAKKQTVKAASKAKAKAAVKPKAIAKKQARPKKPKKPVVRYTLRFQKANSSGVCMPAATMGKGKIEGRYLRELIAKRKFDSENLGAGR